MIGLCRAGRKLLGGAVDRMSKKCKLDSGVATAGFFGGKGPDDVKGSSTRVEDLEYLTPPVKSPSDKKEYSVIRLHNGLTALLITDHPVVELDRHEESEQDEESLSECSALSQAGSQESEAEDTEQKIAACALCVGVGSFSDPVEVPGLAHFLEHMVFMGSDKYPAENEFDSFIKRKGGSDNASTECQHTTFYFECQEEHLQQAIDIFSQFFVAPLMKYDAMARERQAVESEFNMAIPSDTYRRTQLLCSLASKDNPAGKFMWGNLKTLKDNIEDKKLYESVHEFRKRHYSAHRMKLAVQARLPQHVLAAWVHDSFSQVTNNNLNDEKHVISSEPFNMEAFNRIYYVEPVNDICEVELIWPLPPLQHLYKKKPLEYISWLLGHEGKGGLFSYLKKKVWALGIVSGEVEDVGCNSLFTLFSVKIELTENGYKNLEGCLEATFNYIELLRETGPVERIYSEIKQVSDINFEFCDEVSPVENVENLAENMLLYPSEHYITGSDIYFEYAPEEIVKILDLLTPDRANIMVSSKKVSEERDLDKVEEWFGTKYTSQEIPQNWRKSWEKAMIKDQFHLPEPNIYIPNEFTILPVPGEHATDKYPRKIFSAEASELWFKEDFKFKLPQAYISFYLVSGIHANSALDSTMVDLYIVTLGQLLAEEAYPAVVAEMGYSVTTAEKGIVISIYGFDQNLHLLLDKISERMLDFKSHLTPELFDAVKRLQHRQYINQNLKAAVLAKDLRMSATLETFWPLTERLKVLPRITYEDLLEFCDKYFESVMVQGLIQGNMSEERAKAVGMKMTEMFVRKPLCKKPETRVYRLEHGQTNLRAKSFNPEDTNCVTTTYFQHQPGNIRDYCKLDILLTLLEEPLFDTLRTREQLGYDVSCRLRDTYGILGFTVTVVSQRDKVTVDHVEERIKEFLRTSLQRLKDIPEEEFDEAVLALVKIKQYSDVHLKEEVARNWSEIKNSEYVFDRLEKEVQNLQEISPLEVQSLLENLLSPTGKLLLVQVISEKREDGEEPADPTTIEFVTVTKGKPDQRYITDPNTFKQNLYLYPPSKISQ